MAIQARFAFVIALGISSASCSGPPAPTSPAARIVAQETRELQPIVDRYKPQSVMGFDIKGTTLVLSADAEGWSQLDEPTEIGLRKAALDAWAKVWTKHHPRSHATLRLRVQNYYGQEITSQTRQV